MEGVPGGLLVEVRRGSYVESVHRVFACIGNEQGEVLAAFGDIDRVYPIRSLAKPFIALELVRSGAADALGLSDIELALTSGSHDGEERHVTAVRAFLAKAGASEDMLRCGPAMEGRVVVGPPVANNCSGKHAAVLALCRHLGFTSDDYIAAEHPVQRYLQERIRNGFGKNAREASEAIDGCGMPIFGASLHDVARTYAAFGGSREPAAARVRAAITRQPGYAGGWNGNLDTRIITASEGAVLAKIGAEGLHADAVTAQGIGIALKVLDGNSRALPPALARLFVESIEGVALPQRDLAELAVPSVVNAAGARVGKIQSAV